MTDLADYPGWKDLVAWAERVKADDTDPRCEVPNCLRKARRRRRRDLGVNLCDRCNQRDQSGKPPVADESLLLPDDGIVDQIAVEIAAAGWRVVRMTRGERERAAQAILNRGGNIEEVSERLGVHRATAECVVRRLREFDNSEEEE